MDTLAIFGLQLVLSLIVYALMAKWYVVPWLAEKPIHQTLIPLIFPHAFRYMGMVFLVPGVVVRPLPGAFATPAAYGDLLTAVLALLALIALRTGWARALALVWLFNIVGTVRPSKCTAPGECGTGLRSGLVHSDIVRATTPGDSLHDFCQAAQTRALR